MKACVVGGTGFLGRALVTELLRRGNEVVSVGRRPQSDLAALGARVVQASLDDKQALRGAMKGSEVVFHVAALAGVWGPREAYWRTNVVGTQNVLAQCQAAQVVKLVYTSTPSVVFDGRDHLRARNDLPYPRRYLNEYSRTKAIAEREVLGMNGRWGLSTVALRPHLILGPGDPHLLPRLIERARRGKLVQIGDGTNEVSWCWIDNAVDAHLAAAERLAPEAPCAGRAYFVANEDPVVLWPWIRELLEALGIPAPGRKLGRAAAWSLGALLEWVWRLSGARGEPPLTRFVALQLSRSHSYDLSATRADLGWRERVDTRAATELLVRHLRGASG